MCDDMNWCIRCGLGPYQTFRDSNTGHPIFGLESKIMMLSIIFFKVIPQLNTLFKNLNIIFAINHAKKPWEGPKSCNIVYFMT